MAGRSMLLAVAVVAAVLALLAQSSAAKVAPRVTFEVVGAELVEIAYETLYPAVTLVVKNNDKQATLSNLTFVIDTFTEVTNTNPSNPIRSIRITDYTLTLTDVQMLYNGTGRFRTYVTEPGMLPFNFALNLTTGVFDQNTTLSYAGFQREVSPGTVKFSLECGPWPFFSYDNLMLVGLRIVSSDPVVDYQLKRAPNINFHNISTAYAQFVVGFEKAVIVDGEIMGVVDSPMGYDPPVRVSEDFLTISGELYFSAWRQRLEWDPNFDAVLNADGQGRVRRGDDSSGSGGGGGGSSSAVGIGVGVSMGILFCCCVLLVLGITICGAGVLYWKREHARELVRDKLRRATSASSVSSGFDDFAQRRRKSGTKSQSKRATVADDLDPLGGAGSSASVAGSRVEMGTMGGSEGVI